MFSLGCSLNLVRVTIWTIETWRELYAEMIYLCDNKDEIDAPEARGPSP